LKHLIDSKTLPNMWPV